MTVKYQKIFILLGVLLFLTSCSNNDVVKKGEYISFTHTYGDGEDFLVMFIIMI